jgi:hypothetical protein
MPLRLTRGVVVMNDSRAYRCIFCLQTDGGFQKEAHVIPESACNEDLVLPQGYECDRCNAEFSTIEQPIINSFPGQIFRMAFVKATSRGSKPTAKIKGGRITRVDSTAVPTIQVARHLSNPHVVRDNIEPEKSTFAWESWRPLSSRKLSAFLGKIALGYFCLQGVDIYSTEYSHLRNCAKLVNPASFIPFFIGAHPHPTQDIRLLGEGEATVHKTRPIWVTFPGFSGIIPTAQSLSPEDIRVLESFVGPNLPSQFLLITDPDWSKPVKFEMTLQPATEATRLQHRELWNSLTKGPDRGEPGS